MDWTKAHVGKDPQYPAETEAGQAKLAENAEALHTSDDTVPVDPLTGEAIPKTGRDLSVTAEDASKQREAKAKAEPAKAGPVEAKPSPAAAPSGEARARGAALPSHPSGTTASQR